MKYKQRLDGDGFEVPSGTIHRIACCDCGLVHDFVFVSNDGDPVGVAAKRNNRATAQRRRNKILSDAVSEVLHGKGRSKKEKVEAGSALSQSLKPRFKI